MAESSKLNSKNVVIILLVILLIIVSVIGLARDRIAGIIEIVNASKPQQEHVFELEEFVVNLKSEQNTKNFMRIQVALMYLDEKKGDLITASSSKVRDIILHTLQTKTASEMLNQENIPKIKEEIKKRINDELNEELIQEVYFTDMVVQ